MNQPLGSVAKGNCLPSQHCCHVFLTRSLIITLIPWNLTKAQRTLTDADPLLWLGASGHGHKTYSMISCLWQKT